MLKTLNPEADRRAITRLQGRVGNGRTNHPEDILWLKDALRLLGRYWEPERHCYITRPPARSTAPSMPASATAASGATAFSTRAGRRNAPSASNSRVWRGGRGRERHPR
jgi:hypothetical protein